MKRGFTLIETILYIGITTVILTALLSVTYQIIDMSATIEKESRAAEEADFIMHKINWILEDSATIHQFKLEEGILIWRPGSGGAISLNSAAVNVSDLLIIPQDHFIKISFNIDGEGFETTKYLYE